MLHRDSDSDSHTCRLIDLEMARIAAPPPPAAAAAACGPSHRRRLHLAGGKPGYVSPEAIYGSVLDWHAADCWSLGICLYIMLTRRPLYLDPDDRAFELLALGGAKTIVTHYAANYGLVLPDGAAELVTALLRPNPADRPTLEEVLLHPWVREGVERGPQDACPE